MKELFLLSVFVLSSTICLSQFRSTKWGMTLDQVETVENLNLTCDSDGTCAVYGQKLSRFEVSIAYSFVNDKLVAGGYGFMDEYTNDNLYVQNFEEVKSILIDKYGKPDEGGLIWYDKSKKNNLGLVFNLQLGNCYYDYTYKNDKVMIRHLLITNENKLSQVLTYRDPNYKPDLSGF